MRIHRLAAAALPALALAATPLFATVTVTYGDADKFTDAGDRNSDPRKIVQVLESYMKALGDKYLPTGNLAIEILDLDRAGRPRMNLPTEIRVVNGKTDMPCIDLRFTLNGSPPTRERLCDPDFLRPLDNRYNEHDPVVYEKRMLDDWFKRRFGNKPD
jgi:hypothetical protein